MVKWLLAAILFVLVAGGIVAGIAWHAHEKQVQYQNCLSDHDYIPGNYFDREMTKWSCAHDND